MSLSPSLICLEPLKYEEMNSLPGYWAIYSAVAREQRERETFFALIIAIVFLTVIYRFSCYFYVST